MKPLLVGEMPSRAGDRHYQFPLSGADAKALCRMAGIKPEPGGSRASWTSALYERFDCVNAIERHSAWDQAEAASAITEVIEPDREVVVLLGRKVQQAYVDMQAPGESVLSQADLYKWTVDPVSPTGRRELAVIPSPSSLKSSRNPSANRLRSGRVLLAAVDKAREMGETRL